MAKEKVEIPSISSIILPKSKEEKQKAVALAISGLEKAFTKNIVMSLGDRVGIPYPHIPTGIAELDLYGLGIGGVAEGRIIEIFGPESGGKTSLTLQVIAAVQQMGEMAAFVDAEHALDPLWASKLGVDVDSLLVSQPDYGEQALEVAVALVESGGVKLVVVDSVSALVPKAELDGEIGDSHMGLQARMMSQAMRKLAGVASKTKTTVIFINQIREKIGVVFGNPETTTGGRALKFYASVRMDVRRSGQAKKDGDTPIGHEVKIKVVKNKLAAPFRECLVDFRYDIGFDGESSLINMATKMGIVEKSGAWYAYRNERIGQGLAKSADFIRDNGGMAALIRKDIEAALAPPEPPTIEA